VRDGSIEVRPILEFNAADEVRAVVDSIYRTDSRRVLATLIRLLGDFDLAEEALHEAFAAALARWPEGGVPDNPRAWLVSIRTFQAIDQLRRRARFDASLYSIAERLGPGIAPNRIRTTTRWTTTGSGSFSPAATRPFPPTRESP
jgi:DNA-directed RNA polymerase specialized sigma24 family protein